MAAQVIQQSAPVAISWGVPGSINFPAPTQPGSTLVLIVNTISNQAFTVTGGGTWSLAGSTASAGSTSQRIGRMYVVENAASVTTVAIGGAVDRYAMLLLELTPTAGWDVAITQGTPPAIPATNGGLLLTAWFYYSGGTTLGTTPPGWTRIPAAIGSGSAADGAWTAATTTGNVTPAIGNNDIGFIGVGFKPVAVAPVGDIERAWNGTAWVDVTEKWTTAPVDPPPAGDALGIAQTLGAVQTNPLVGVQSDREWEGTTPTYSGGLYTSSHPAGASRYRSEIYVSSDDHLPTSRRMQLVEGQRFVIEFDQRLASGWRHPQPGNTVLWQLIGRSIRDYWPGPPVVLNYENLQYRIATSPTYPNSSGAPIGSYEDRRINLGTAGIHSWHHWMVSVLLGGPGVGTIDAWCDGVHFADNFRPGNGTWYKNQGDWSHLWVFPKVGMYGSAGSAEGTAPTAKVAEHKNLRVTVHDTNGTVKTWRSPTLP